MGVICDGGMDQRLINVSKDVLGYMDALLWKEVKSQNTVRVSFSYSFALLVLWL